jgi:AraC-like DNA-binding protein
MASKLIFPTPATALASRLPKTPAIDGPSAPGLRKLAHLLSVYAPYDGPFELALPGVHAIRVSHPNTEPVHATLPPALCVIAQGAKIVMLGQEVYEYDASRMLVYSVDLPIAAQVARASRTEPYLGFKLELDPYKVAELALKVFPDGVPRRSNRGLCVVQATDDIINAIVRLIELMAQPGDADLLAPLVVDEILIRLLRSPIGSRVAQIGHAGSRLQRVAKAIAWIRANFSQPMAVQALADLVHMSVSSFHQHFKAVTSMSPLQYQKVLRLQEARRLMLSGMMDAGTASRHVGYLSASQFSREYARLFGSAPTKDVARLREQGITVA